MENVTNQAVMETFVERAIATETAVPTDALAALAAMGITPEAIAAMMAETKALKAELKAIHDKEAAAKAKAQATARKRFLEEPLTMKVSEKGCLSVGNIGTKYGVTLRPCQWRKIGAKIGAILGALDSLPGLVDWDFDGADVDFDPTVSPSEKAAAMVEKAKAGK